uniref:sodium ion-translocating decarboxylase subunit beta n=1 Tax=Klebsiella pneumoniae TaxID=573 RepID=UPI0024B39752
HCANAEENDTGDEASIVVALFAEAGTFAALLLGIEVFGLPANEAASIATIGGADGPMVLFASLILAPNLFVPIAIIAYLYLSLTYAIRSKLHGTAP